MKDFIQQLGRIRYYAIFCSVVVIVFAWAQWQGFKLIGDDNESKEQAVSNSHNRNYYYHK